MQEYHYTESGLDTVWLANGFRIVRSDRGESLVIEDIEGLHAAIGRSVVEEEKKLTGPEIRFLRTELLLSQNALSRLLGVTEQTVARWEKGKVVIPTTSDATLRQLYLEHVGGAGKITELLQRLADIEHGVFVKFTMERERKHWDSRGGMKRRGSWLYPPAPSWGPTSPASRQVRSGGHLTSPRSRPFHCFSSRTAGPACLEVLVVIVTGPRRIRPPDSAVQGGAPHHILSMSQARSRLGRVVRASVEHDDGNPWRAVIGV